MRFASGHVGGEFFERGDALVQALAGDSREFELDHVEPGGIFGRVVHIEARGQGAGLGGRQVLVEDCVGVGVRVVLHEHDFLSLGVVGGHELVLSTSGFPKGLYLLQLLQRSGSVSERLVLR